MFRSKIDDTIFSDSLKYDLHKVNCSLGFRINKCRKEKHLRSQVNLNNTTILGNLLNCIYVDVS